jgi:hypothetical protein
MTKHTSSPWNWTEGSPSITRTWNGTKRTIATVGMGTLCWHEDPTCAAREAGANARLIAAAPELLQTLENLIEKSNLSTNSSVDTEDWDYTYGNNDMLKARAIVAKAKGYQDISKH